MVQSSRVQYVMLCKYRNYKQGSRLFCMRRGKYLRMNLWACPLNYLDFTVSDLYTPVLGLRYMYFKHNLMDLLSCGKMVTLRKKCTYSGFSGLYIPTFGLNTDIYSVNLQFSPNAGKCEPEKLQIWTLFTQWNTANWT